MVRSLVFQAIALAAVVGTGWYLINNVLVNLEQQSVATGFGFLDRPASFDIGEHLIEYDASRSYGRALVVGFLNTLRVAVVGIVLATVIGTVIGIARLSTNWLVAKLASAYVEIIRNVPVLLHLFFWYAVITESMPGPRQALNPLPGVFLSNRGLKVPVPEAHPAWSAVGIGILIAIIGIFFINRYAKRRQAESGDVFPAFWLGIGLLIGLPTLIWLGFGAPIALSVPELQRFNFVGGTTVTPEFFALLTGLVVYTAGFIAEIVRGGILAVSQGQTEAASALGLRRGQALRLVILPQALRTIIPPTTSQYLNLTKNSSLAVAIGYPDLVNVANTSLNQTGQAVELVSIMMAVYLSTSLLTSLFMNWYNSHIALKER